MNIPYDKKLHLAAGLIAGVFMVVIGLPQYAWAASVVAGVGKEVYDYITNKLRQRKNLIALHTVDHLDAIYTFVPGILISLIWLGMQQ